MNTSFALAGAACGCGLLLSSLSVRAEDDACLGRAEAVLAALDAGEFEQARADFNPKMRDALSAEQLGEIWQTLPRQVGERLSTGPARISAGTQGTNVVLPLQHAKAWLDLSVSCNPEGQLSGLWIRPGTAPAAAAIEPSEHWTERAITVTTGNIQLPGLLTLPRKAQPIAGVVLVHGSGSHDRDETIGPNKPFRDLAHGLAKQGIAVLRYDKRSQVNAASFAGKPFTVKEEVIDDAVAALALLAARPELAERPLFVLGHSLGAMLAPRIAAATPVAGMILLAAPARGLTEIIPQQMTYIAQLDGNVSAEEEASMAQMQSTLDQIDALTAGDRDDPKLLMGAPAAYWLDLEAYQPITAAQERQLPILLLQGESDYQVTMTDDYRRWVDAFKGNPHFRSQSFPGLSHLFMPAGQAPGPADYAKASHVDAAVIKAVADWVQQQISN
ncbi:MAG: alpha/beta fold hydrolase [Xanthomonadales bacterium]|nr:alpha/beta fold hydrolase [Xanthomonadales bacterium]